MDYQKFENNGAAGHPSAPSEASGPYPAPGGATVAPYPPVQNQPVATGPPGAGGMGGWMPTVQPPSGCPPGLEYLSQLDQLLVKQQVELLEAFTGIETANKYEVLNSLGQRVYFAAEDVCCGDCCCCIVCCRGKVKKKGCCKNFCCRQCLDDRALSMTVTDNLGQKVMTLDRPLRCRTCWCPCCLQKMDVFAPPGTLAGTVEQSWSLCYPNFKIKDADGATVLRIEGPLCTFSCCGKDVEFKVLAADGTQVGRVAKQWTGFVKEMYTDADNFGITFPMDLDVKCKATILAACFLIDFMFFEDGPGDKKNVPS